MKRKVKMEFTGVINYNLITLFRIIFKKPIRISVEKHEADINFVDEI